MQPILTPELKNKILDVIFNYNFNTLDVVKFLAEGVKNTSKKRSWDALNYMSKKVPCDCQDIIYEYFIREYILDSDTGDDGFVNILNLYFNKFMLNSCCIKNEPYEKIAILLKENGIDLYLNYGMKELLLSSVNNNIVGLKEYQGFITVVIERG